MPSVRSLISGGFAIAGIWLVSLTVVAGDEQITKAIILITLQDETAIDQTEYSLGQVATIQVKEESTTERTTKERTTEEKNTKLVEQLKVLPIGRTPRVGYVDKVRQTEILAKIEKEYPGLRHQIKWEGPSVARIRSVGTAYDKEKIIGVARVGLNHWLGDRYRDYSIRHTGDYQDIVLPTGDVEVVPRINEDARLNKRMNVWVDILVNGDRYQSLPIWFAVEVPVSALVMNSDAKKGNVIVDNQVRKEVIDIAAVGGTPFLEKDALVNKRLQKDIKAGEAITADRVEDTPAVVKDHEVIVEAQVGAVIVKAIAIALEDGKVGEKVKVRKPETAIDYEVTVVGRNRVSSTKE